MGGPHVESGKKGTYLCGLAANDGSDGADSMVWPGLHDKSRTGDETGGNQRGQNAASLEAGHKTPTSGVETSKTGEL